MIVSDFALYYARDEFLSPRRSRNAAPFDDEDPASVKVLVRLPGAENLGNRVLVAVLFLKEHEPPNRDETDAVMGVCQYNITPVSWTEVERCTINADMALEYTEFKYLFLTDRRYEMRVEFFTMEELPDGLHEEQLGFASAELTDIIEANHENLDVHLMSMTTREPTAGRAEFALSWITGVDDKLLLEVRVKINRKSGWPFSTNRPFFVLYRWEPRDKTWTPLYRSEVLTKVSDHPDARGSMFFQLAEISTHPADLHTNPPEEGNDTVPLRLEFFHYKTTEDPKLLGSSAVSLFALRQAQHHGKTLALRLNTFPEGELVGKLLMVDSRISKSRYFFSLQAEFGGDVVGDFVYFDLSLTLSKGMPRGVWGIGLTRGFYCISRYNDKGRWEPVYRSEVSSCARGNHLFKYKIAKITAKKLNRGFDRRSLLIEFYREKVGSHNVVIGYIQTSVAALLETAIGTELPIESRISNCSGRARLEQIEVSDSRKYFALNGVLSRGPTPP